jgi:hypothetical protein
MAALNKNYEPLNHIYLLSFLLFGSIIYNSLSAYKFCHLKYFFCFPGRLHHLHPPSPHSYAPVDVMDICNRSRCLSFGDSVYWLKLTMWSRVILEKLIVVWLLNISQQCVELERSLLCLEEPTTVPFVDVWFTDWIVVCIFTFTMCAIIW